MSDLRWFASIVRQEWAARPSERWAPVVGLFLFGSLVVAYIVAVAAS